MYKLIVLSLVFSLPCWPKSFQLTAVDTMAKSPIYKNMQRRIEKAYNAAGFKINWHYAPILRNLFSTNRGIYDGTAAQIMGTGLYYTNLIAIPVILGKATIGIYTTNSRSITKDIMKDLKVGYLRGRLFGATETDHKLIAVEDSYPAAFKLLQKGQVDCLVMIDEVAQAILKKQGIDKKIIRSGDFSTIPIYHHIHKKNQKYFNQIKDAIAKEFSKNK